MVRLTDDERTDLESRFCGRLTLRERNRVQILLRSDRGDTDEEIAAHPEVCVATVAAVRCLRTTNSVHVAEFLRDKKFVAATR